MKILFVCKHNRFRSKVAEAIFGKLDEGKNEAKSAGFVLDLMRPFVAKNVHDIMKSKGYLIINEKARELDSNLIEWADLVIITANNIEPWLIETKFKGKKIENWKIADCDELDESCIKDAIEVIEAKTGDFIKRLELENK